MDAIYAIIETISSWLGTFWDLVKEGLAWCLDGILLIIQFALFTIFDGLLIVIEAFFSTLDLSSLAFNYAAQWSDLSPQTIWIINELALPQGVSLLVAAMLIRMLLNLIPAAFTRI